MKRTNNQNKPNDRFLSGAIRCKRGQKQGGAVEKHTRTRFEKKVKMVTFALLDGSAPTDESARSSCRHRVGSSVIVPSARQRTPTYSLAHALCTQAPRNAAHRYG